MRALIALLMLMPGPCLGQGTLPGEGLEEGREEMHVAIGASLSASPGDRCMGPAWITGMGSRLWLSDRAGIRADLLYQRFGLSEQMRRGLPSGAQGYAELTSLNLTSVYRFPAGAYLHGGLGLYHRAVVSTNAEEGSAGPRVTRGGWSAGLGWEGQRFFIELAFHRVLTPGGPTDVVPLAIGSWF